MNQDLKIFFFGAPYFSKKILENLLSNDIQIDTVITHPDKPIGRKKVLTPTEVKFFATQKNIKIKEFHTLDTAALDFIQKENPDLFIVAAYGALLPNNILSIPKMGALNVHPSLLPKLRGSSPIQTALLQGLKISGTTIMIMDEGMDTGNILIQKKLTVPNEEVYPSLEEKLIDLSSILLIPLVKTIIKSKKKPMGTQQDHKQATFTKLIQKQSGKINWQATAKSIYNQWRAFHSWPGIYTSYKNMKLTLTDITLVQIDDTQNGTLTLGEIYTDSTNNVLIKTVNGSIKINTLQLAGKNTMLIKDFLNGQPDFIGTILK